MTKENSGAAFPMPMNEIGNKDWYDANQLTGMSLREYAAIHLKVADSGKPWLDEMIEKARRDEFAAHALGGLCANSGVDFKMPDTGKISDLHKVYVEHVALMADAMMEQGKAGR